MKRVACAVVGIVVLSSSSHLHAQSTLPLQEQCASGAAQLVARLDGVASYTSRYNKKLDSCFARVGFYLGQVEEQIQVAGGRTITLKHPHWMVSLYKVYDSKIIGTCSYVGTSKQECSLASATPATIEEFEALVSQYMDE